EPHQGHAAREDRRALQGRRAEPGRALIRKSQPAAAQVRRTVLTRNCFAYGTLMHAPIMAAACGHRAHGVPAVLRGFARHPVRGAHYPGIAPDPQGRVHGLLYRDLTAAALGRLDRFEGMQYVRRSVRVELAGDGTADAE